MNLLQTTKLNENQGQELRDEIANMLLNMIETKDTDHKVEAAINAYLTRQNSNANPAQLARNLSWSVKVRLSQ